MRRVRSIACIASHSALDVFDGARDEGFRTIAIAQRGRDLPYREFPVVDELIVLDRFSDITRADVQRRLVDEGAVLVPNRSLTAYVGYDAVESLEVPIFGNRWLLRWEERVGEANYYRLLDEAGVRRPRTFSSIDEVDRPVIVKVMEAGRPERAFFIASDADDARRKARMLVERGVTTWDLVERASIEELVVGTSFNANFFRSIAFGRVELHSLDRRLQTNIDDLYRVPAKDQLGLDIEPRMVEIGHVPSTIRESMLEKLFEAAHSLVNAVDRLVKPGLIGPFTIQFIVTPTLDIYVYDVAFRIGGGTNAYMGVGSQYSKLYFGKPISMGRRIAMEIRMCQELGCLERILT